MTHSLKATVLRYVKSTIFKKQFPWRKPHITNFLAVNQGVKVGKRGFILCLTSLGYKIETQQIFLKICPDILSHFHSSHFFRALPYRALILATWIPLTPCSQSLVYYNFSKSITWEKVVLLY